MKKKLLFLGLIMMFVLTACGKDIEGYKKEIYTPIKENVEKLDKSLGDYIAKVEELRNSADSITLLDTDEFSTDLKKIEENVNKIKDLESFEDEQKKQLKEIKSDFKTVVDDISTARLDAKEIYQTVNSEAMKPEYNKKIKSINENLDKLLEKFTKLNKEYEITDKIEIKNKIGEFKEPDKVAGQLTAREDKIMENYLTILNSEKNSQKGLKTELDKDTKTLSIVFANNYYIADKGAAKTSAESMSKTLSTLVGKGFTVQIVQDNKRDNPFIAIKDGEIVVDNLK
ncbi:hypothetical protein [Miniphocaeibacter massiliensis]|uniref:hypothetical protein n=1 Tax=Miniphocaeibacter massiliensis TaxID=2041841 RepID=UPI000C1C4AB0|nr:hypothetical protein [Miniphocaeibacter massiliensis]